MNKTFYRHIPLIFLVLSSTNLLNSQDLIDPLAIRNLELYEEKNINTSGMEFSPAYYRDKIIFVYAPTRGKSKDQEIGETYFNLGFAAKGIDGKLLKRAEFPATINTELHQGPAFWSKSLSKLYFTRAYEDLKKERVRDTVVLKIYESSEKNNFSTVKQLPFNSDKYSTCHPALNDTENKMLFATDRPGGVGKMDIWQVEYNKGKWENPTNLGNVLNSLSNDIYPFIWRDSILIFTSDRPGGFGGYDLYYTYLINLQWTTPQLLPEPFNSPYDDFSLILSKDGTSGYFSSNRPGGSGKDDIYSFSTNFPIFNFDLLPKEQLFKVNVFDKLTFTPLKDAVINISNFDIQSKNISLGSFDIDLQSGEKEGELILKLLPKSTQPSQSVVTDNMGQATLKLNNLLQYIIEVVHPEYENFKIIYYDNGDGNQINCPMNPKPSQEKEEPELDKIEIKKGTTIVFNNIFFDYNSADLKPDAMKELDQIYKILIDNPLVKIQVSAHTDSRGVDDFNLKLSEKRAQAAKKYLTNKGIKSSRIVAKGFGESKIRNRCKNDVPCSEDEHKFNRRIEVEILEK